MRKFTIIIIFAFSLLPALPFRQAGLPFDLNSQSITWQRTYDGDGPDNFFDGGFDVCDAGNGNFFIVGHTDSSSMNRKIWVLKINPYGDTIWTKEVTNGLARCVTASGDGGCVLTGSLPGVGAIKLDSNGNIVWYRSYIGLSGTFQLYDIIKTSDEGYIACGRNVENTINGYVLKIDSQGNLQWQMAYPAAESRVFRNIIEDTNKTYLLVGHVSDFPTNDTTKINIFRIDSLGETIWEKRYKLNNRASVGLTIEKITTGYIVGGSVYDVSNFFSWIFFLKLNTNGDTVFSKIFPTSREEYFGDMQIINNNRYVIAMSRDSTTSLNGKAIITDSSGNIIAEKIFPATSFIIFDGILPISNGDILFVGSAEFCEFDCEDVYALRTDNILNAPPPIGIRPNGNEIPKGFRLYPNYPNPFNPMTYIKFDISEKSIIKIIIYDVTGKEVNVLIDQKLLPGSYEISFASNNLSSGVYFYQLIADGKIIQTNKMVLIR